MENPTYDPLSGTWRTGAGKTGDKKPAKKRSGTKWAVNRAIAQKLRKLDCDPVTLLARIATDEEAPVELRYRATTRLALLLHDPKAEASPPAPKPKPKPDLSQVVEIIEAAWRKDDEEKAALQATSKPGPEPVDAAATITEAWRHDDAKE
jgi:hypothetical protein